MNATINGQAVTIDRPSANLQEEKQPDGSYKIVLGSWVWKSISCTPKVEITSDLVVDAPGERWSYRGARWDGDKIAYDGVTRGTP